MALLALIFGGPLSGCTFQPDPLIAVDPSFRADRPAVDASVDAGLRGDADARVTDGMLDADGADAALADAGSDAGTADAEPTGDGGEADLGVVDTGADAGTPDSGLPLDAAPADAARDAGLPDALPLDAAPDVGPRDASAPDAAPRDSGPDAGLPDSGRDGGPADSGADGGCAAPPWTVTGTPQVLTTIPVALADAIDLPPLIADLDGDGFEEIAIASAAAGEITILDWQGCALTPSVTTNLVFLEASGMALAQVNGREVIVTTTAGEVRLTTYDGPGQISFMVRPQNGFNELSGLMVHPLGTEIVALGERGAGPAYVVPRTTSVVRALGAPSVGSPAFVTGLPLAARYAITTATSLVVAAPDQVSDGTLALMAGPVTGPAVVGGAYINGNANLAAVGFGAVSGLNPGFTVVYLDASNPGTAQVDHVMSNDRSLGDAIGYAEAAGPASFYQLRAGNNPAFHTLQGCTIGPRPQPMGGFACRPVPGNAALPGTVPEDSTPISVFLSGNLSPDLAVVTAVPPRLTFYRPNFMSVGPAVVLPSAPVATPGLSTQFLSRYSIDGEVMFVPSAAGVDIVGWRRPATSGPDSILWTQSRGDARRSGRL